MLCKLCPRECNIDRSKSKGYCGQSNIIKIARAAMHHGEETCISGVHGTGAIFFSGCTLGCKFCQNEEISHGDVGKEISVGELADIYKRLEDEGADSIDLVTPTPWVDRIIEALDIYKPNIPIIYNTGGYESVDTIRRLKGYIDVYLPDIKYCDAKLSKELSGAENYMPVAMESVREMIAQVGEVVLDERGLIQSGVMIRHMVLPLHTHDSKAVLEMIAREYGTDTWLSILYQYTPMRAVPKYPELSRPLTKRERDKIEKYVLELGFSHGYIQEAGSEGKKEIPKWDF